MFASFIFLCFCFHATCGIYNIEDFGAVPNNMDNVIVHANTQAIIDALNNATVDMNVTNRVVLLPANKKFYFFNVSASGLDRVMLRIEGNFTVSNNITEWERFLKMPKHINDEDHPSGLMIMNSSNFILTGNGYLDGQGHDWWDYFYREKTDNRPFLFRMKHSRNVEIYDIHLVNSPFWNMDFVDMLNLHIHDMGVYVDWPAGHAFAKKYGKWDYVNDSPFPANTDGMDLRGKNVLVENVVIECGDDAVAIKPTNSGGHEQNCSITGVCKNALEAQLDAQGNMYTNCSQDMVIRNVVTIHTTGLAIGSIPPDPAVNCIRNITFENIEHTFSPFRALYIKTNPGTEGTGIVDTITVRNMIANGTQHAFIDISPQAQQIPGTNGTGCNTDWPFRNGSKCPTQPYVSINNILIEHAWGYNSVKVPGILWCDKKNPCHNVTFLNVQNTGDFTFMDQYMCQNVFGGQMDSNGVPETCLPMFQFTNFPPDVTTHANIRSTPKNSSTKVLFGFLNIFLIVFSLLSHR